MTEITDKGDYAFGTLVDAATISWNVKGARVARVTLAAPRTLGTPQGVIAGQHYMLQITQGGVGNNTLTVPSNFLFSGGGSLELSTGVGVVDLLSLWYDGENFYCTVLNNYQP